PSSGSADTAYLRVLGKIQANGTFSAQTALEAFMLAYGELPGVQAPAGPSGTILSGTLPLEMALAHWNELSTAQQQAIQRALQLSLLPRAVASTHSITLSALADLTSHSTTPTGRRVPQQQGNSTAASHPDERPTLPTGDGPGTGVYRKLVDQMVGN